MKKLRRKGHIETLDDNTKRECRMSLIIQNGSKEEKRKMQLGPRAIFLKKYRVDGDIVSAIKELDDSGFNTLIYNDETYQKWIDEDRDK